MSRLPSNGYQPLSRTGLKNRDVRNITQLLVDQVTETGFLDHYGAAYYHPGFSRTLEQAIRQLLADLEEEQ